MKQLTAEQREILQIDRGAHLVLAPPGTGKTELLSQRLQRALRHHTSPTDIICLTFTNRAANNMRERLTSIVDIDKLMLGTIHSFCSHFLHTNQIVPQSTVLLDEQDAEELIEEVCDELCASIDNNQTVSKYAAYLKRKALGFADELMPTELQYSNDITQAAQLYNDRKTQFDYIDFDDLLTLTYAALCDKTQKYKSSTYRWIQVDEAQDLTPLQWAIVQALHSKDSVAVYFGDYNQSIFSFMGVRLASLHNVEDYCMRQSVKYMPRRLRFPITTIISDNTSLPPFIHYLQHNFRSPSYLVRLYIDYAKTHFRLQDFELPSQDNSEDSPNDNLQLYDAGEEPDGDVKLICHEILPALTEQTAILVRTNRDADRISKELHSTTTNASYSEHFKISGFDLFHRKTVKSIMAFLTILTDPNNRLAWTRLYRDFKAVKTLHEARTFIHEEWQQSITPKQLLSNQNAIHNSRHQRFIDKFAPLYETVKALMTTPTSIGNLIEIYLNYIRQQVLTPREADEDIDRIEIELVKLTAHINYFTATDRNKSLFAQLRKYIPQYQSFREADLLTGNERLIIATVHKSKGLEFENVIVQGVNAYWYKPDDESKRLLFVAMTRARRRLYITFSKGASPMLYPIRNHFTINC